MPTIFRIGPYRFGFFSNESLEPPHIHVKSSGNQAKFWLDVVELASNYGYKAYELSKIEDMVLEHRDELLEAWHEYFS